MSERTSIDKMLGKQEIDDVKELIKKSHLTREELLELLYRVHSTECKLLNLDEKLKYLLSKYFVWIGDFILCIHLMFDFAEQLKTQEALMSKKEYKPTGREIILSEDSKKMFSDMQISMEEAAKFLITVYYSVARPTVSIGAMGLKEASTTRIQSFSQAEQSAMPPQQDNKPVVVGRWK
jgi:hypothetical protein